jgi:hypothetical protein
MSMSTGRKDADQTEAIEDVAVVVHRLYARKGRLGEFDERG